MEIGRNGSVYRVMTPSLSNIFTDNNSDNDDNMYIQGEIALEHQGNRNNIMSTFIRLRHIIRSQFSESAQPNNRPATRESIEKLKQRILSDNDSLIRSGTECIICQDIYEINKFVTKLPCGHEYHQECIVHWLNQSSTCPICRHSIDNTETITL
ncbi:hypothetical protein BJ944DRAFT_267636 [Cunninghamella echinulata]|nr:hypothetical protein BJ944DRAFT_267636 [Cunninghamella echinulata]